MTSCGDPDDVSRKSNPLLMRYGRIQLTFIRNKSEDAPGLQDILVSTKSHDEYSNLPESLQLEDFSLLSPPTKSAFLQFVAGIDCPPLFKEKGQLHFASGVVAAFEEDLLTSLRLSKKEVTERPPSLPLDEREPTAAQIFAMLDEATRASNAHANNAALLIAWAALEAALRINARLRGIDGRSAAVPQSLIRELTNQEFLSLSELHFLEETRQRRTATAHGLSVAPPSPALLQRLIELIKEVLERDKVPLA
jgi:hypothetical protein